MTPIFLFFGTVSLVLAMGMPVVSRLARVQLWRTAATPDLLGGNKTTYDRKFSPIDFGPTKMRWPSETPRESKGIPERPWPSATWDDPDFGRASTMPTEQDGDAIAARNAERQQQETARAEEQAKAEAAAELRRLMAKRATSKKQAAAKSKSRNKAVPKRPQPKRTAPVAQPKPATPPPSPVTEAPSSGLPTPEQLDEWVSSKGLAGAVKHLMNTQGWDFKQAAAWLAKNRRR